MDTSHVVGGNSRSDLICFFLKRTWSYNGLIHSQLINRYMVILTEADSAAYGGCWWGCHNI